MINEQTPDMIEELQSFIPIWTLQVNMPLNSFDKQLNFNVENESIRDNVYLLVLFKCVLWIDTIFYVKMNSKV
jgi:hypothetical protein